MKVINGKPCHQMLESCGTVEQAIAFFERNWEESFAYGQLLVADRTGKSAVIRAKDGKLDAPLIRQSQGIGHRFGLRGTEAVSMLAKVSTPTLPDAVRLLRATLQEGVNATKYSVVFNLNAPDIYVYRFPEHSEPTRFNLSQELEKGPHYYDIPDLPSQLTEPLQPLTDAMRTY
jgi:hypothetical protein